MSTSYAANSAQGTLAGYSMPFFSLRSTQSLIRLGQGISTPAISTQCLKSQISDILETLDHYLEALPCVLILLGPSGPIWLINRMISIFISARCYLLPSITDPTLRLLRLLSHRNTSGVLLF